MAEARASDLPVLDREIGAELARIEDEVDAGRTDLGALGFWRIVARVKLDRILIDRHADAIGRIDGTAFRAAVRPRFPVWLGNAALLTAVVVSGVLVGVAGAVSDPVWKGVWIVAAGLGWAIGLHCPTHWVVGWFVGIRFLAYTFGGPPPPRPGLKSDYATYLRADAGSRAWMHASGAIATKVAPFLALVFVPVVDAPWWAAVVLLVIGVGQIATDVRFSTATSDWKRFARERRVARALADV
jgi:hypothetical protein